MNVFNEEKTLFIEPKESCLNDVNILSIHPNKISWLTFFQKETINKCIIQNVPSSYLNSNCLFYILQILKPNGQAEVYVYQPISVMQSLDASELEANAKLAGFTNIIIDDYETVIKDENKIIKQNTIKITMKKQEKNK